MAVNSEVEYATVAELCNGHGFSLTSVLRAAQVTPQLQSDQEHLRRWQKESYSGEMQYMQRDPALFIDLEHFLPSAKSVLCVLVPYAPSEPLELECPVGYGRVARYAWGRDYHRVLKKKLTQIMEQLSLRVGRSISYRVFTDAVPLLERAIARNAELGFIGKNTLLIRPSLGSFTFLAEVVCDLSIAADEGKKKTFSAGCGTCVRCQVSCPTNALVNDRMLDARKCISYLTIEKRSAFSCWEAEALGSWVFGCDICQEVCPYNHRGREIDPAKEFSAEHGTGGVLNLKTILEIATHEQFVARFGGTALMRAGRAKLLRNACAVLGNQRELSATSSLARLAQEDSSEIVRTEATRTLERFLPLLDGADKRSVHSLLQLL